MFLHLLWINKHEHPKTSSSPSKIAMSSSQSIAVLVFCYALVHFAHNLEYSDLETLGIACSKQHKCQESARGVAYRDEGCGCDSLCVAYQDCCAGHETQDTKETDSRTGATCLNYGFRDSDGIYAISTCPSQWSGSMQVKQNCEDPDISELLNSFPLTSTSEAVTYKNRYCAECNNVDIDSLKPFQLKISCEGVNKLSDQPFGDQFVYNEKQKKWGINWVNGKGEELFKECEFYFDLPSNLKGSVHFCLADVISTCARDWSQPEVQKLCGDYMAVVYYRGIAYKNPHCAICNNKAVSQLSCSTSRTKFVFPTKRVFSFSVLLDVRRSFRWIVDIHGKISGSSQCPTGEIYDPFFKKCRKMVCALPGYVIQNNQCVRSR